jgi:hypothetical protein
LYRVKYDEGTVMQAEDAHLEHADDVDDSDEESDNELGGSEAENSNDETVYEEQVGGFRFGERGEPVGGLVEDDGGGNVTAWCEEEPLLLHGVALYIVKFMPANTKTAGRSTWQRLDK